MAEMYTPEEIQDIFDAYNKELAETGKVSAAMTQQFNDATKGVKNYTYNLKQSLDKLGSSIAGIGKQLYNGEQGASVFNDSISAGADAVAAYTSKMGIQGKILGAMIKAGAAYIGAVNKQADSLYKSFQDISRAGTIGAGGIKEVYTDLKAFGYGVKELGNLQALLQENSKTLANFGGTAMDGARQFSELADTLQHSDITARLMNMGLSVDEINKGAASYLKQQTLLGRNASDQGKNLATNTAAYIEQLEAVTRLTGMQRSEIEERNADAMREGAFARKRSVEQAAYDDAMRRGDEVEAEKHRKQMEKLDLINYTLEGDTRKEAIAAIMGDVSRSTKLFLSAGPEAFDAIRNPAKGAGDVLNSLNKGFKRTQDSMGDLAYYGDTYNKTFIPYNEQLALNAKLQGRNADELIEEAKKRREATDTSTKNLTNIGIAERKARDNMEDFVNLGIKPVTYAMEWLAKVVENLTSLIPGAGRAKAQLDAARRAAEPPKSKMMWAGGQLVDVMTPEGKKLYDASEAGKKETEKASKDAQKSLAEKIIAKESGGKTNAQAAGSSAFGLGQLTKGTFEEQVRQAKPGSVLFNKTWEDYKSNEGIQRAALDSVIASNQSYLSSKGLGTSDAATYLAHFLGPGGAAKVLQAPDNVSINSVVGREAIQANPSIFENVRTVADMKAWADKKMGGGGYAFGGIASGPNSGYQALLHGTEAIVPLPDGRTIPVEMRGFSNSMESQNGLLSAQIAKLNDIISIMQNQVSVSRQILKQTG